MFTFVDQADISVKKTGRISGVHHMKAQMQIAELQPNYHIFDNTAKHDVRAETPTIFDFPFPSVTGRVPPPGSRLFSQIC